MEKSNFAGDARHRSSSFSIGNNGYTGLGHINSGIDVEYEDFWKYDPSSDSWSQIANYPEGRCYHAASFVIGNKAYVGTGRLENGTYSKKFFCYDPVLNSWSPIPDLPGAQRRGAVAFTVNGKGYVGTGQVSTGYSVTFYEYDPLLNQWFTKANFPGSSRTSSVAFSIGDFGYVGTGSTNSGSTNDFYQYNPVTNQWVLKAAVGPTTRQEAVGFAVNGKGYIGTGDDFSSGNNFSDMWEYEPLTNIWVQTEDFAGTARRYLTAFVIGDRVYAGTGTNGTNFKDFWMFDKGLSVLPKEMENTRVSVYPNPAKDNINFNLQDLPSFVINENITVEIYSIIGERICSKKFEAMNLQIDLSGINSGQYIYQLKYENNTFKTGKLTFY